MLCAHSHLEPSASVVNSKTGKRGFYDVVLEVKCRDCHLAMELPGKDGMPKTQLRIPIRTPKRDATEAAKPAEQEPASEAEQKDSGLPLGLREDVILWCGTVACSVLPPDTDALTLGLVRNALVAAAVKGSTEGSRSVEWVTPDQVDHEHAERLSLAEGALSVWISEKTSLLDAANAP